MSDSGQTLRNLSPEWRELIEGASFTEQGKKLTEVVIALAWKQYTDNEELRRRVVALEQVGRELLECCSLLMFARNDPDWPDCVDRSNEAIRVGKDAGM